jgi:transcriptional regulator with XRE-family HTH domain
MQATGGNIYQICRKQAEITQESAAEMLYIDVKTLSNYENEKSPVPDEVVARMAEIYGIYSLPFYHLKYYSPLGKFLPDYVEPENLGDMGFQAIIAKDEINDTVSRFTGILKDCKHEVPQKKAADFTACMDCFRAIGGKVMSIEAYGRRFKFAE